MSLSEAKLEFWAKNKYNVCLAGRHGVGKTGQVKSLFNRLYGELGTGWLYFSAPTMDPWVDFVGVPKEKTAEDGTSYLGLVRPEVFARDQVKAIFLDEYNRSQKKVKNAVMELIQFKSINGHKFHNLEVIWTAINPLEEEEGMSYDVEELDPAQLDRFHVYVEVPYAASKPYFVNKFGKEYGAAAVEWWNGLNKETKDLVSPRRLDYAIDCFVKGGDVRDILDKQVNVSELLYVLSEGSIKDTLRGLVKREDKEAATVKLQDENFYTLAIKVIMKDHDLIKFFIPLMPDEKFSALIGKTPKKKVEEVLGLFNNSMEIREKVDPIINTNSVTAAKVRTLKEWVKKNFATTPLPHISADTFEKDFKIMLNRLIKSQTNTNKLQNTHDRVNNVNELALYLIAADKADVTNKITKREAKKAYRCLLYFICHSQRRTYEKVSTNWDNAVMILNSIYPFDDALYKQIVNDEAKANTSTARYGYGRLRSWGVDLIQRLDFDDDELIIEALGEIYGENVPF